MFKPEANINRNKKKPAFFLPAPEIMLANWEEKGQEKIAESYKQLLSLAEDISTAGGKALLVGGCVRDILIGTIPKDFDIEIYGLTPDTTKNLASKYGTVSEVGRAFGVIKLFLSTGLDIDLALPRRDSKAGTGHKGIKVETDANMTVAEASLRRDFTINSLSADLLTQEINDPWGGLEDLQNKILRLTDINTFKDDPLRILRGIQFIGRFGLSLEPKTALEMTRLAPEIKDLSKERIYDEWEKLLLKSPKPSLGLQAGLELKIYTELFPELERLAKTPQDAIWHPEGNVWEHTMMVCDSATELCREKKLTKEENIIIMLASLCHDLGKPSTTEEKNGHIISYGHEEAGVDEAKKLLLALGTPQKIIDCVLALVKEHLAPSTLFKSAIIKGERVTPAAIRNLANRISPATIEQLLIISEADHRGRGTKETPADNEGYIDENNIYLPSIWLLEQAQKLNVSKNKAKAFIAGKEWLELGFRGGPRLGQLIALSDKLHFENDLTREQIITTAKSVLTIEEAIAKLNTLA